MGHYIPTIDYLINTYFIYLWYKLRSHGTVQSKGIGDAG